MAIQNRWTDSHSHDYAIEDCHSRWERFTLEEAICLLWEGHVTGTWGQPARAPGDSGQHPAGRRTKWPHPYSHKQLKLANNLYELGGGLWAQDENTAQLISQLASEKNLNRRPHFTCTLPPYSWKLWHNTFVLISAIRLEAICYKALENKYRSKLRPPTKNWHHVKKPSWKHILRYQSSSQDWNSGWQINWSLPRGPRLEPPS